MRQKYLFLVLISLLLATISCTTTKRKGEVSKLSKAYHNTTAQYNGYFNANELYTLSKLSLEELHQDNYNQLLPLYTYRDINDVSSVSPQLDISIEKVSRVINLHRVSNWTDDCYLLLGKAQYLKQDFETAEKTFEYFVDEMNPAKLKILKKSTAKKKTSVESKKKKKKSKKKKSKKRKKKKIKIKKNKRDEKTTVTKRKTPETSTETIVLAERSGGGLFSREPAYNEGLVWMGKTYIERERWPSAAYIISKLESTVIDKKVAREIPVLKAYFFLRQKKYSEAIAPLHQAVALAKKPAKARYAYILAQLYEDFGDDKNAYEMYDLVLDNTHDYEMEFNAQLNLYKNSLSGKNSGKSILKELEKMLKEDKYIEYRDQIYFTRAEIKFKQGDFSEAIKDYQLSLQNNLNNSALKAEVYYILANRYFEQQEFVNAKNHFDSTMMFMPKTDDRFPMVVNYVKNLNQIAINLSLIQVQDSLIRISQLSRDEQEKIALEIKKQRDKIRKMQTSGSSGSTRPGNKVIDRTSSGKDLSKVSSFFAYNENSVRTGKMDFRRKWDDRVLEDDWRRSNKQGGYAGYESEGDNEQVQDQLSDAEFKTILKDVPFNELQLKIAVDKIKKAMLGLGILYREKLNNYQRSADILDELVTKYPGIDEECKAFYYLHLSYKDLFETQQAQNTLNAMITEYPDCSYTQVLTDPEYLSKQMKLLNKKENYYQDVYKLYEQDQIAEAYEKIKLAGTVVENDLNYTAKFDFLEALCLGKLEGRNSYIKGLEKLIKKYPNTPEEIKAKEILRFLKGDKEAFDSIIYDEATENFVLEFDKLHYIFVVLFGTNSEQLKEAKREISKYNGKYHKLDRLRISNIYLDTTDDVQIILVRKFSDKTGAMKYFYKVEARAEDFLPEEFSYEIFAISQKNYREVIKQRSVNAYREFFSKSYLEK